MFVYIEYIEYFLNLEIIVMYKKGLYVRDVYVSMKNLYVYVFYKSLYICFYVYVS